MNEHRTGGRTEPAISEEDWWLIGALASTLLVLMWAVVVTVHIAFGGPDMVDVQVISNGNELLELRCEEWR